jgi:Gpi18-like mannosyltransferase
MQLSKENKNKLLFLRKILLLYSPFVILLIILKTKWGHGGDMYCWIKWTEFSFTNGLSNVYKSWTDYLPLYQYVLFFFGKIQGSVEAITNNIYKLKSFTIFFELASTLILFKILNQKFNDIYKSFLYSLFYFLNMAVLYNCVIWGQVDGILTFFLLCAVILGYKKKLFLSLLFFMLAVNMKLQAIIFFPIIALLILPLISDKQQIKKFIYSIFGIGIIQLLIFLPFIYAGDFSKLWNVITGSVGKYPKVSMNAYNMWYFFIEKPVETLDSNLFLGTTYKTWGLLLFFTTSFFALLHFIKQLILKVFKKADVEYSYKKTIISCALIPLLFFFFNTQMHERYSHPAFIFLAIYAMLYNRPLPFILGSLAYFLNLEDVLRYLETNNYHTLVFAPWFIAIVYLLLIVLLFIDLYVNRCPKNRQIDNKNDIRKK